MTFQKESFMHPEGPPKGTLLTYLEPICRVVAAVEHPDEELEPDGFPEPEPEH